MRKALTIIAASALALGAAACSKSEPANTGGDDNMLVPADENAMGGDMNAMDSNMAMDNSMGGDTNASNAM